MKADERVGTDPYTFNHRLLRTQFLGVGMWLRHHVVPALCTYSLTHTASDRLVYSGLSTIASIVEMLSSCRPGTLVPSRRSSRTKRRPGTMRDGYSTLNLGRRSPCGPGATWLCRGYHNPSPGFTCHGAPGRRSTKWWRGLPSRPGCELRVPISLASPGPRQTGPGRDSFRQVRRTNELYV